MEMISLADALAKYKTNTQSKFKSQRSEIISELYSYYKEDWRKNTWKNYIAWLKQNKIKHSGDAKKKFEASKSYHKIFTIKYFCVKLAHIPTEDLYYLISIAKDKANRNESFNKWLFWALKV